MIRNSTIRTPRTQLTCCLLAVFALTACGCGTGDYKRRMRETVEMLNSTVDVNAILFGEASALQDSSLQQVGVALRLPQYVVNAAVTDQPGGISLPGFAYYYPVESGNVLVAAVPVDKNVNELKAEVKTELNKTIPGADWADSQVPTPDGGSLTVPRISGSQSDGQRLDLYLLTSGTHHVMVGWRAPAENASFFQSAEYSMGSAMVSGG